MGAPLGKAIRQVAKDNSEKGVIVKSDKRRFRVQDKLEALDPREREFVRRYTDPTLPSFGNATESARLAGYAQPERNAWAIKKKDEVADAIRAIQAERELAGREVDGFLSQHSMDAAHELVRQLSQGNDLQIINPQDALESLGSGEALGPGDGTRLKEINNHNRNVIQLQKNRREAAETLVSYEVGTPEQRVRIAEEKVLPDVLDLASLTPEQLKTLSGMVEGVREMQAEEVAKAREVLIAEEA